MTHFSIRLARARMKLGDPVTFIVKCVLILLSFLFASTAAASGMDVAATRMSVPVYLDIQPYLVAAVQQVLLRHADNMMIRRSFDSAQFQNLTKQCKDSIGETLLLLHDELVAIEKRFKEEHPNCTFEFHLTCIGDGSLRYKCANRTAKKVKLITRLLKYVRSQISRQCDRDFKGLKRKALRAAGSVVAKDISEHFLGQNSQAVLPNLFKDVVGAARPDSRLSITIKGQLADIDADSAARAMYLQVLLS